MGRNPSDYAALTGRTSGSGQLCDDLAGIEILAWGPWPRAVRRSCEPWLRNVLLQPGSMLGTHGVVVGKGSPGVDEGLLNRTLDQVVLAEGIDAVVPEGKREAQAGTAIGVHDPIKIIGVDVGEADGVSSASSSLLIRGVGIGMSSRFSGRVGGVFRSRSTACCTKGRISACPRGGRQHLRRPNLTTSCAERSPSLSPLGDRTS